MSKILIQRIEFTNNIPTCEHMVRTILNGKDKLRFISVFRTIGNQHMVEKILNTAFNNRYTVITNYFYKLEIYVKHKGGVFPYIHKIRITHYRVR